MSMATDDGQAAALVRHAVEGDVRAAGWFHPVRPILLVDHPGVTALPPFAESVATFLFGRRSWRMPSHSYWVVTDTSVQVFELRFGAQTTLKRQVASWERAALRATPGEEPNSMVVEVPDVRRPIEVQGDRFTPGEPEVIRLLARK
jgi:hypothetical protein